MIKLLVSAAVAIMTVCLLASCAERPVKRADLTPEEIRLQIFGSADYDLDEENVEEEPVSEEELDVTEDTAEEIEEPVEVTEEVIDTHVYSGEELTDELIAEKIIGYWETDEFGYLMGYYFFDSGFLQLVLKRKVSQTGIYMIRYGGIYFSLDSKNWDEDVLIIDSISHDQINGRFGDNSLTLKRADENLVEENSGVGAGDENNAGLIVDAATEVKRDVKAS